MEQPEKKLTRKRIRDWVELARLPNVFTAVADPLAGALLVGAGLWDVPAILLVMLASACLYTGGIVLNDWNDYKRDLQERPDRPLPSKRISRLNALIGGLVLLAAGPALTLPLGTTINEVATLLLLMIVTYDILLKHMPIAPGVMGLCRGLNILMGMMVVPVGGASAAGTSMRAYIFMMVSLYILGVTLFARREAQVRQGYALLGGAITTWVAALGIVLLPMFYPHKAPHHAGLIWGLLLLGGVVYRMTQALLTPGPATIQLAVKTGVLAIILMDAALVAFTRDLLLSIPVVLLLIPAIWFGRWLYST